MANSLYPAFVQIVYQTPYHPHIMTIPTTAYTLPDLILTSGAFEPWIGGTREADDMINDLVTLMLPFYLDTTSFLNYTIFTMDSPTAAPLPRFSDTLALVGTGTDIGYDEGVQSTFTARTTEFGLAKLVLLDSGSFDNFDRVTNLSGFADAAALFDEWTSDTNGWSGRDNARPNVLVGWDRTLNKRLEN